MKFHSKLIKLIFLSFLFVVGTVACTNGGSADSAEPDIDAGTTLNGTQWQLQEFGPEGNATAVLPDTTLTLHFTDEGINGSAGCNSYFGEATVTGSEISFGPLGSTKMACLDPIMQQETDFLAALASVTNYSFTGTQLTLTYEDGTLLFNSYTAVEDEANEETEAGDGLVKTLFVGPELVDCVGEAPQTCLQVRESENEDWTLLYDQIVGFEYEPGYEYELLVTETEIDNPPADGSSIELSLVEVVSKTAVTTTIPARPESNELQGTSWVLTSFGPNDNQTAVLPNTELTLNFDGAKINGSAGCNSYFADATVEDGKFSVGLVGSTLMACLDEEVMAQESAFLATLAQATSYTRSGMRLTLHGDDGSLEFVAASMHETSEDDAEVVDWETAVAILNSGDVVEIFQTHSLDVRLTLQDGRIIKTVEPNIDDIFRAIEDCGEPCSDILMATE